MLFALFVFLLFGSALCSTVHYDNETENLTNRRDGSGFLFSIPKFLISGQNKTVCLSIHEAKLPAKTIIDVKWKEKHFPTMRSLETEHSCFDLYIPKLDIKEPHYVSVKVQVQLNGDIQSAHNQDPILVYPNKIIKTFIHTDRSMYKPTDKVRFRIMAVDEKLLPVNQKIPAIRIKNPLDVTVAVWDHLIPQNGLVHLEYDLVSEAITGKWKIEALGETKTFEVLKYTLPRYKIDLSYPKLIYYNAEHMKIIVCGRYSYGKPVRGLAFIKVTDSFNNMQPVHELKDMKMGCAEFTIPAEKLAFKKILEKFPMYDPKMFIHLTATVTEKGTNRIDITTGRSLVYLKAYTMKFSSNAVFQPGLPYQGKLKLSNINVDISTDEVVEICYNIAIKKSWNFLNDEQCQNLTVEKNNMVEFAVLPMRNNVIHIHFNARSLNHTDVGDSFRAVRLFSPSSSYIFLQQILLDKEYNDDCRAPQQFKIVFTADGFEDNENITFYYMIKSLSQIYKLRKVHHQVKKVVPNYTNLKNVIGVKHKFIKLGTSIDGLTVKFRLDRRIVAKYQLLVYYITKKGETVAATKIVNIEPCLMKINAKWHQQQMVPGALASLDIKTASAALCSISAVDKSTKFLPGNQHSFSIDTLLNSLGIDEKEDAPQSGRKICVPPTKRNNQAATLIRESNEATNSPWELRRRKRHVFPFSEDYDTYDIFNNFGVVVITNLRIVTKPCYSGPLLKDTNQVQFLTNQYDDQNEESSVSIRSNFPETWLWELLPVSNSLQLKRHLPHTITNWVTNVVCISEDGGVGISEESELTSFQPFFVDILTPYTVKREEAFYMYIHISNYLIHKFPIKVTLRLSEGLKLKDQRETLTFSYCLSENNTVTHSFHVEGMVLGLVNATVVAEVDNLYPEECGPETIVSKRDVVLKKILVESEGYPMKIIKSALLCTSDTKSSNNVTWSITTPEGIVPETVRTDISFNGDLLGRTIENLEELLDVPTGCGEQIVATMAPNLYVMKYLNASNTLKNSMKMRILRNLKIGYQRILNYAHKDGSFSAFGYHDPDGSMFLTAFVVRTLHEAKKYIYVDQRVIDRAVFWIIEHQLENGCFNTMFHVFQDMGGTSKENSTAALTAYVMISLLEANINVPSDVQTNAQYCIKSQRNPDKYTLAITCYALYKLNWNNAADRLLQRLLAVSNQQQNKMWWTDKENTSSATEIEITSYALLSFLHKNTTDNLAHAQAVVRWLASKYGANGGFKSTQDTVVALDALTRYAKIMSARKLNLNISLDTRKRSQNISLRSSDNLKSRRIHLEQMNGDISVSVFGEGCVLAQVMHSYYLRSIPKSQAFTLAVDVAPVSNIDRCSIASLSPCLAYVGPDGPTSMAVMEINLPSGYEADRGSLYKLVEAESTSNIKMFEEENNKVNIYFTKVDKQMVCFTFNIYEHSMVEARKESLIKLFDYYRPEFQALQFYAMNKSCQDSSPHIPEIIAKPPSTTINKNETDEPVSINNDPDIVENIIKREKRSFGETVEKINGKTSNTSKLLETVNRSVNDFPRKEDKKNNVPAAKREYVNKNLNQDFIDMDIDMEMPDGMEGNLPVYIKPGKDVLNNMTKWNK